MTRYTENFKVAIVANIHAGKTLSSLSRTHGIARRTLRRWRDEAEKREKGGVLDDFLNRFYGSSETVKLRAERDMAIAANAVFAKAQRGHLDVIRERDVLKAELAAITTERDALKEKLTGMTAERDAEPTEATQALDALDYQMKANKALENDIEARKRIIERLLHYLALLPRVKPEETTYEGSLMGLKLNED